MDWLYARYWLPKSQPVEDETVDENLIAQQRTYLQTLLSAYKTYQKQAIRDVSQANAREFDHLARAIEKWTIEAATARIGTSSLSSAEQVEEIGCTALAEVLIEVGNTVPLSKQKRMQSRDTELPRELVAIWDPLLERLDDTFDNFLPTLVWQLLDVLAESNVDLGGYIGVLTS